jgi:hypothetical protein
LFASIVYLNERTQLLKCLHEERVLFLRFGGKPTGANLFPGIGLVTRNGIKHAFVVTLVLQSAVEKFMAVILIPGPVENGWKQLAEIEIFVKSKTPTEFECTDIPRTISRRGYSMGWNLVQFRR